MLNATQVCLTWARGKVASVSLDESNSTDSCCIVCSKTVVLFLRLSAKHYRNADEVEVRKFTARQTTPE